MSGENLLIPKHLSEHPFGLQINENLGFLEVTILSGLFYARARVDKIAGADIFACELQTRRRLGLSFLIPYIPIRVLNGLSLTDPRLRGEEFLRQALRKFQEEGFNVAGFRSLWNQTSDNYTQFRNGLEKEGDFVQAAWKTWTGRTAKRLGFSELLSDDIHHTAQEPPRVSYVEAYFWKPNQRPEGFNPFPHKKRVHT